MIFLFIGTEANGSFSETSDELELYNYCSFSLSQNHYTSESNCWGWKTRSREEIIIRSGTNKYGIVKIDSSISWAREI